jgi:hypothetical protein
VDNKTVTAETPGLLNSVTESVLRESAPEQVVTAEITPPSETMVNLPGGYINSAGEVIRVAEVRELTGRDEEMISKSSSMMKAFQIILSRGVVSVGDEETNEQMLDKMLVGDRDALLLGIYKATFGPIAELGAYCSGCEENKTVQVDVDNDIEVKFLENPIRDREFTVKGRKHVYQVVLPTGVTTKALTSNTDNKTLAELQTILLEQTVTEIDEVVVLGKNQIQNLGVADRRKIRDEITDKAPGPQFSTAVVTCPDCEGEVAVPINLGALFRF